MWIRHLLVTFIALCSGLLVSGGVFSVLLAADLLPRFAGKTNTARQILFYEEMVVLGTMVGCIISVFLPFWGSRLVLSETIGKGLLLCGGFFAGSFVGSIFITIAEVLDSIPIMTRRVKLRHGLGILVCSLALGKLVGSILYYTQRFFETAQ